MSDDSLRLFFVRNVTVTTKELFSVVVAYNFFRKTLAPFQLFHRLTLSPSSLVLTFYSVERDAQLLANRIALLKQEEMKTRKKIEETRKRAGEVMKLKQRNNEKVQEKMEKMQYDQMVSSANRQRIVQMNKERNIEKTKIQ